MKPSGLLFLVYLAFSPPVNAAPRIAVLNFELIDITSLPNTQEELARTASMKPMLEQAIGNLGGYEIIQVDVREQNAETAGVGYLFNFSDVAAKLGKQSGAEWVVVGRHSKPSFLFSYVMAHLVNVKTRNLVGDYAIELNGNHRKVTQRGINALAKKIIENIK